MPAAGCSGPLGSAAALARVARPRPVPAAIGCRSPLPRSATSARCRDRLPQPAAAIGYLSPLPRSATSARCRDRLPARCPLPRSATRPLSGRVRPACVCSCHFCPSSGCACHPRPRRGQNLQIPGPARRSGPLSGSARIVRLRCRRVATERERMDRAVSAPPTCRSAVVAGQRSASAAATCRSAVASDLPVSTRAVLAHPAGTRDVTALPVIGTGNPRDQSVESSR
jgi:hypothetical protein